MLTDIADSFPLARIYGPGWRIEQCRYANHSMMVKDFVGFAVFIEGRGPFIVDGLDYSCAPTETGDNECHVQVETRDGEILVLHAASKIFLEGDKGFYLPPFSRF